MKNITKFISEIENFDFLRNEEHYLDELVFNLIIPQNLQQEFYEDIANFNYDIVDQFDYDEYKISLISYLTRKFSKIFIEVIHKSERNVLLISQLIDLLMKSNLFYNNFLQNYHQYKIITSKILCDYIRELMANLRTVIDDIRLGYNIKIGWENIFVNEFYYQKFNDCKDYIFDDFNFCSFIFQKMLQNNFIYPIQHIPFATWLLSNEYISEKLFSGINENAGFTSKGLKNKGRLKVFENVFEV